MATITVTTFADAVANDGQVSLREALFAANGDTTVDGVTGAGDDTIVFSPLAIGSIGLIGGELLITSNVTINGDTDGDGKADITLSGADSTRLVRALAGTVTLESLNLADGFSSGYGGAILVDPAATLTLVNSTVVGSSAGAGGAIATFGTLTVANSTLIGNTSIAEGGAIAIAIGAASVSVMNTTITGNVAGSFGGGIDAASGTVTVSSSTITANTAVMFGGGIRAGAAVVINNSIVSANNVPVPGAANLAGIATGFNNIVGAGDTVAGGGNIISDAPLLGPLADNGGAVMTMLPQLGSPAINGGNPGFLPLDTGDVDGDAITLEPLPLDARGLPRISGGLEIGAAEANTPPTVSLSNTLTALLETANTSAAIKVADIPVTDTDDGTNTLSLSGADSALFAISGNALYLKAGAKLDFETNPVLDVTVNVDDTSLGATPDDSDSLSIAIGDVAEKIVGNSRANTLRGTAASESIYGLGRNDTISGGGGNDTIFGGAGADRVRGGSGADLFVFKPGDLPAVGFFDKWLGLSGGSYDRIGDFRPGVDRIDLHALDANSRKAGNQAFHFDGLTDRTSSPGELTYEFDTPRFSSTIYTVIKGDTNGDGNFDFRIVLNGRHHLDASDFIL